MLLPIVGLLWLCTHTLAPSDSNSENRPLLLTPLIEKRKLDLARNLSKVDPTLFDGVASHTGFITVNKIDLSHLFFWFFPTPGQRLDRNPWMIWLQGGPGDSSLYGLFKEIGPLQIVNGTAKRMPISWGTNYSLLFIDNPVGSGFSFTENDMYLTDNDQVGAALLNFLQQFLELFPELRTAPLFIAGESYAGKYIPAFGHYIHNNKNASHPINLRGLAIGGGFIDPITLLQYSKFGLQTGLLDPNQAKEMQDYEDAARSYYAQGNIEQFSEEFYKVLTALFEYSKVSPYNYLKEDNPPDDYANFLENKDVRKAIHVSNVKFYPYNPVVAIYFNNSFFISAKDWLEELLEHYGVMCYSGQLDVIVAYALSVNTYQSLKWSDAEKYKNAVRKKLFSDDKTRFHGYVKEYGNFMDVMIRDAGHTTPEDQPAAAKQIIDIFINKFK